jgi:pimeloyl-ACP methyl ester carboxylesterase
MRKLFFVVFVLMIFMIGANAVFAEANYLETAVPSTTRDATIPAYFLLPEGEPNAVVVMIHGHHGNHNEWGGYDVVANGLAESGVLVAELDFPGCGASAEDYHLNAMSYMCNDVLDVINYAKDTYGVTKVGAMGYSMGGRIVSQMLIEDMIKFDSIVFVAPAVSLADMVIMFGGQENYDMMKETIKGTDDMYPFPGAYGEQLLSNEFFNDLEAYGEDMAELAAAKYDGDSLTIYSTNDSIVSPSVSQGCADAFGSIVITESILDHSYNFYGQDPTTVNALNTAIITFFSTDLAE